MKTIVIPVKDEQATARGRNGNFIPKYITVFDFDGFDSVKRTTVLISSKKVGNTAPIAISFSAKQWKVITGAIRKAGGKT